jgi:hypothetical protein
MRDVRHVSRRIDLCSPLSAIRQDPAEVLLTLPRWTPDSRLTHKNTNRDSSMKDKLRQRVFLLYSNESKSAKKVSLYSHLLQSLEEETDSSGDSFSYLRGLCLLSSPPLFPNIRIFYSLRVVILWAREEIFLESKDTAVSDSSTDSSLKLPWIKVTVSVTPSISFTQTYITLHDLSESRFEI